MGLWQNIQTLFKKVQYITWLIGLLGWVFANGLGDLGSVSGRIIPKTKKKKKKKIVLDTSLLNTQQYKVHIKGKVEQSRERSSVTPTPRCNSYLKGSLLVTLDYSRQLYLQYIMKVTIHNTNNWHTEETI